MTREENRARWSALVSEQMSSGMGAAAWCRKHSIGYASLLYWKRVLSEPAPDDGSGFVELVGVDDPVPHRMGPLSLDFGGGLRLELAPGFDAVTLGRALSVIRECWR